MYIELMAINLNMLDKQFLRKYSKYKTGTARFHIYVLETWEVKLLYCTYF